MKEKRNLREINEQLHQCHTSFPERDLSAMNIKQGEYAKTATKREEREAIERSRLCGNCKNFGPMCWRSQICIDCYQSEDETGVHKKNFKARKKKAPESAYNGGLQTVKSNFKSRGWHS